MTQTTTHTLTRSDDPDLHVAEIGPEDARPIVLLHGLSLNYLSWREQFASDLADDYRLVAPDLRGHGESGTPRGAYDDGAAWAGDVRAVLDALDLDDAVLVGWSYGSLVALDYLAAYGTDRVAGVNLIGVVVGIGTDRTDAWLGDDYVGLFPEIVSTDAETSVATLARFVDLCFGDDLPPADRYLHLGCAAAVPPFVRDGMRDRSVAHFGLLEELSVPALLTHGERDPVVSVEAGRAVAELVPDSRLSVYEGDGHAPFWVDPERFGAELRAFVEEMCG